MPSQKRKFGDIGEAIAEDWIKRNKYTIIEKNYWKPWGEIDIVSKKSNKIIFFEVKTRELFHVKHFLPEQSVNTSKMKKLKKVCVTYLLDKRYSPEQEWQIDILSILINKETLESKIEHIENAVWEERY